jgi:hypothetical protein
MMSNLVHGSFEMEKRLSKSVAGAGKFVSVALGVAG